MLNLQAVDFFLHFTLKTNLFCFVAFSDSHKPKCRVKIIRISLTMTWHNMNFVYIYINWIVNSRNQILVCLLYLQNLPAKIIVLFIRQTKTKHKSETIRKLGLTKQKKNNLKKDLSVFVLLYMCLWINPVLYILCYAAIS